MTFTDDSWWTWSQVVEIVKIVCLVLKNCLDITYRSCWTAHFQSNYSDYGTWWTASGSPRNIEIEMQVMGPFPQKLEIVLSTLCFNKTSKWEGTNLKKPGSVKSWTDDYFMFFNRRCKDEKNITSSYSIWTVWFSFGSFYCPNKGFSWCGIAIKMPV